MIRGGTIGQSPTHSAPSLPNQLNARIVYEYFIFIALLKIRVFLIQSKKKR